MKYFLLFSLALLFLAGCSATKEIESASLTQAPCRSETEIKDPNEFVSETAENLLVYQQGDLLFASMDVRTYCNARITFDVERKDERLMLKLRNSNSATDDCVCITNVTASLKNVESGDYTVMVTNASGNQLLAQTAASVK